MTLTVSDPSNKIHTHIKKNIFKKFGGGVLMLSNTFTLTFRVSLTEWGWGSHQAKSFL